MWIGRDGFLKFFAPSTLNTRTSYWKKTIFTPSGTEASVSISKKNLVNLKVLHELNFNKICFTMKINLILIDVSTLCVLCDFMWFCKFYSLFSFLQYMQWLDISYILFLYKTLHNRYCKHNRIGVFYHMVHWDGHAYGSGVEEGAYSKCSLSNMYSPRPEPTRFRLAT